MKIGIRKEDKSPWERRVPLVPEDIRELARAGIQVVVEASSQRAVSDAEFEAASEYWGNEPVSGRIELCRDAGVSIFAARSDALDPDVFDFIRDSVIH